jgi:hypothetical protein
MMKEDRLTLAARLAEFSNGILSTQVNPDHITLKVENRVAIVVSGSDQVGFYIRSTELLERIRGAGFATAKAREKYHKDQNKYLLRHLSLAEINSNEALFKEIVLESVETIKDQRPKEKNFIAYA